MIAQLQYLVNNWSRNDSKLNVNMRTQITAYLHADTKAWLRQYARGRRLKESEVIRLLLEREQQVGWLNWALSAPDAAQGAAPLLARRTDRLPPRWNNPPQKTQARKSGERSRRNRTQ